MKNLTYAGIGSRETPMEIINLMMEIGEFLALRNVILRSGHAGGADLAFESGCDIGNINNKEIWLPWSKFNGSDSKFVVSSPEAFALAEKFHPAWDRCSQGARKLHARNMHQVLGADLNTPSDFVICYTKNGMMTGGTAQAIRLANHYNIPVFNIGKYDGDPEKQNQKTWDFITQYIV